MAVSRSVDHKEDGRDLVQEKALFHKGTKHERLRYTMWKLPEGGEQQNDKKARKSSKNPLMESSECDMKQPSTPTVEETTQNKPDDSQCQHQEEGTNTKPESESKGCGGELGGESNANGQDADTGTETETGTEIGTWTETATEIGTETGTWTETGTATGTETEPEAATETGTVTEVGEGGGAQLIGERSWQDSASLQDKKDAYCECTATPTSSDTRFIVPGYGTRTQDAQCATPLCSDIDELPPAGPFDTALPGKWTIT